ncbi:MAG: hypothetical protein AAGU76_05185 [Sedimentibacter sp.]|uniref:hypothetical protein n=1 Tax=Sedimentibacter sp. TaxID=1960295 RepID=UPI003157FD8A
MKKCIAAILIIAAAAAWFLNRQPELCINVDGKILKLHESGGFILTSGGFSQQKLMDERLLSFKTYDIDGDSSQEIIALTSGNYEGYGKDVVFYDIYEESGNIIAEEMYREDFSGLKPWKIDVCRLESDSQADILIGVQKDTTFYSQVRRRPFFYSWDGEKLVKKWLGSYFSTWDLKDIAFGDFFGLGFDAAAVLEENENGQYRIGFYHFAGFGFENMNTSGIFNRVKSIKTVKQDGREYAELDFYGLNKSILLNH